MRAKDHSVATNGTISDWLCDHNLKMKLSLPVSFLIPKSSYSAIQFVLPKRFSIRSSTYFPDGLDIGPKDPKKPSIGPPTGDIAPFTYFEFFLTPSDEKELDIVAKYPAFSREAPPR